MTKLKSNIMKPKISVLTPSWERASYLERVWAGLNAQTFRDFEWIVANDGSTDNTNEVVQRLSVKSNFPVTLISASCRVGKSRMDNELVKAASGEFALWCDSDDYFVPTAFDVLLKTWNSIPCGEYLHYCGVSALCDTECGILGKQFYGNDETLDLSWNELYHKLSSDLVIFTRTELLKSHPFYEVDFLIPEASVWNKIGVLKTRFIPIVLQRKRYGEKLCLSFSGHMSYNRGNAYAMAMTRESLKNIIDYREKLRRAVNYLRYCRHGDITFKKALSIWRAGYLDFLLLAFLFPISELLALKDTLQGKVIKTHLDFDAAAAIVKVQTRRLNFCD